MSTKTATKVKDVGINNNAALYALSEPLGGHSYVVVSAVNVIFSGPETYIFAADEHGEITDWLALDGSFRGSLDHERALYLAGYELSQ